MINLTLTSYSSLRWTWKGTMLRLLAVSPSMHIIPSVVLTWTIWAHSFQFSCSVISDSLQLLAVQHARLPCLSPTPGACSNSCPSSQWCHPTISSSVRPLLLLPSIFQSIRVFSNELTLCIRWSKYWSFSFGISLSNEYSGVISFRIDWFDLAVQRALKSLLQH